jgi:glycosyltransferase involved in cell wall biosynthesis
MFKYRFSNFLIDTGLWELIFSPKLSDNLKSFVKAFSPDVIYCQGYNLTFTWLPVAVNRKFNVPICFQTGDDWPMYLYRKSPIYFLIKPIIKRSLLTLLSAAGARLSNGKLMTNDYLARYNVSFKPLMMCDDPERFDNAIPKRSTYNDGILVVYSGGLANGRWESIIDLCQAAINAGLSNGIKITVNVFTSVVPKEAVNKLQQISNLKIMPNPSHEELPSYLKGADILFLPETFDPAIACAIRLSISTKAHLYMMSEKPVLIYGSPLTGIVDYAKSGKWAHIIDEQGVQKLTQGLNDMINNPAYCRKLVENGNKIVSENHDKKVVATQFLNILKQLSNERAEKK